MQKRVAVLYDGFIPVYRVNFYKLLNQVSGSTYVVYHGSPPLGTGQREFQGKLDFPNTRTKNIALPFLGRRVIYQPVIGKVLFGAFDAVVLGHEIRFVSNLVLFVLCKIIGRPVIWWGHGVQKDRISEFGGPILSTLVKTIKKSLGRLGDMYIVYTEGGAAELVRWGIPKEKIKVVRNTIDMKEQAILYASLKNADARELRKKLKLRHDSKVLLYIGRLYSEKKVDELLALVERLNAEKLCGVPVETVIIGEGPELPKLRTIGANLQGVQFTGELYDQRSLAEYLRIASALVIPGKVGLAVNHAFSHGVPLITRDHHYHAPEIEYVINGKNGLIIGGDFDNFVHTIAYYLNSRDNERRMSAEALKTGQQLTLEFMGVAFDEAVTEAIRRRRRILSPDVRRMVE